MIDKSVVTGIVSQWLEDKDYFLVDVTVSTDNKIVVEIDHAEGVWIEDCVELSRYIESNLNRDDEDYELEVGSAGIGQPFKVLQQYIVHKGCPDGIFVNRRLDERVDVRIARPLARTEVEDRTRQVTTT